MIFIHRLLPCSTVSSPPEIAFSKDISILDCIIRHEGDYITLNNSVRNMIPLFSTLQEYFEELSVVRLSNAKQTEFHNIKEELKLEGPPESCQVQLLAQNTVKSSLLRTAYLWSSVHLQELI